MLGCQRDELLAPIRKERIAADQKRADAILHHCRERRVDVANEAQRTICFILGVDCSSRGAGVNGGSGGR
jgi:hypothetical protein